MRLTKQCNVPPNLTNLWLLLILSCLVISMPNLAGNTGGQEMPGLHNSLVLSISTLLSGPAAHLGINMRKGVLAALKGINPGGGETCAWLFLMRPLNRTDRIKYASAY